MAAAGVELEFVDVASAKVLVRVTEKPADLPPWLVPGSRVPIAGWLSEVISLVPPDRASWVGGERVVVTLRRIERLEPKDAHFTLPTISEELPPLVPKDGLDSARVLELHEDDWRQVELFGAHAKSKVKQQIRAVQEISRFRVKDGWSRMHVRDAGWAPLEGVRLTVDALEDFIPAAAEKLQGISFRGQSGVVDGGLAWATSAGGVLYALADPAGAVTICGWQHPRLKGGEADDAMLLGALLTRFGVRIADWCGAAIIEDDRAGLERWLAAGAGPRV